MKEEHEDAAEASGKAPRLCEHHTVELNELWQVIRLEAERVACDEPRLQPLVKGVILDQECLGEALSARLSRKLAREDMGREDVQSLLKEVFREHPALVHSAAEDIEAIHSRDPACDSPVEPLLFYKGFAAISTYRVSHQLWKNGRRQLAYYFQSLASEVFGVDIHPAARIGCGIMLDHATSFVVGETAIIEDNVSILHEVTLGGTGKETGARHPIVRSGVLIGAGAKILGRVEICEGAKIGAGSVVLNDVEAHTTVAGVPAEVVGRTEEENPAMGMNQGLVCRRTS
ncbi:serine O-acetyltransferase [Roseibacillus persicicus]|uniref:Serine acetyltransferase n=1 Tax=Roseibacillus persicicus TaxID=454148 RepID=A0A918WHA5_9BACT|nr:serine O-acetyltransferase [Roseibacillus persicicus]MDQ8191091.1 serine O-acetyltransferase [Roseibacillus persicicus]GHC47598.1 serine O-acetyltransferase [Roseibacillus persicicus]